MKRLGAFALAATVSALYPVSWANAWEFEIIDGSGAGTIKACAASHEFRNAWVTLRVYGEQIDIVYHHDDFSFPYDKLLGQVLIRIDDKPFLASAISGWRRPNNSRPTASTMMISPKSEEYGALFSSMKNGREMQIIFPNGDVYPVPLRGSAKALQAVSACWLIRETGPNDRNPFDVPAPQNPFQTPAQQPVNPFEQPA